MVSGASFPTTKSTVTEVSTGSMPNASSPWCELFKELTEINAFDDSDLSCEEQGI